MHMQQIDIRPEESRYDVLVRAGMLTTEQAEEMQTSGDVSDEAEGNRQYDQLLEYMRVDRTIGMKALFLGADHAEVTAAMQSLHNWDLIRVIRRATKSHKQRLRQAASL